MHVSILFVDLPTIVSGDKICYIDPQKTVWKDAGCIYKLPKEHPAEYTDSFAPFKFENPCALKEFNGHYKGTLFRFPLRSQKTDLSNKLYTVHNLKDDIIKRFINDLDIMLLFLCNVKRIAIYSIKGNGTPVLMAQVMISKESQKAIDEKREYLQKVKSNLHQQDIKHLSHKIGVDIENLENNKTYSQQWVVTNMAGTSDTKIINMSKEVSQIPWVGLAVCLDASKTGKRPSRLFRFLPTPDSEDTNPPLPVHVHGTFMFSNNYSTIMHKLGTSSSKHSVFSKWNKLLASEMLPHCYKSLLTFVCENKFLENDHYLLWPSISHMASSIWNAFLPFLFKSDLFLTEKGNLVNIFGTYLCPRKTDRDKLPRVVISALEFCNKEVIFLPSKIWDGIDRFYDIDSLTIISPSTIRSFLKQNPESYLNMEYEQKLELLNYCLEEEISSDLTGLELLPVVSKDFVPFEGRSYSGRGIFIYPQEFPRNLLLTFDNVLVDLCATATDSLKHLHSKLQKVAGTECTQLKELNDKWFVTFLHEAKPESGFFSRAWIETFWMWVNKCNINIANFIDIPIIPISSDSGFKTIKLTSIKQSTVILCEEEHPPELLKVMECLGCNFIYAKDFEFVRHCSDLENYIHWGLSPTTFLGAVTDIDGTVNLSDSEAELIRLFLFDNDCVLDLTERQIQIVSNMKIFKAMQRKELYCISGITNQQSFKVCIIQDAKSITEKYIDCFPQNLLCIECNTNSCKKIKRIASSFFVVSTKTDFVMNFLLPAIGSEKSSLLKKVMAIVIDEEEFESLLVVQSDTKLRENIEENFKKMAFVPTSMGHDLTMCVPREVYDPEDVYLKDVFKGIGAFPSDPYSSKHYKILRKLGMKTKDNINPQDIVKAADHIHKKRDSYESIEIQRAKMLLNFLTLKGSKLLHDVFQGKPLYEYLYSKSLMPVLSKPPKSYPDGLKWKGSGKILRVCASKIYTAADGKPLYEDLPFLIGSQAYILDGSAPAILMPSSYYVFYYPPLKHMIPQFLGYFKQRNQLNDAVFRSTINKFYHYFNEAFKSGTVEQEDWQDLCKPGSPSFVIIREGLLVNPGCVALKLDENCTELVTLEPYWYILPDNTQQYQHFFCSVGVRKCVGYSEVLDVLVRISQSSTCISNNDWKLVTKILTWLPIYFNKINKKIKQHHLDLLIPIYNRAEQQSMLEFQPANKVAYLDEHLGWLKDDPELLDDITESDDLYLVHSKITEDLAKALQLKVLNCITNQAKKDIEKVSQSEPLVNRISRIMKEYKESSVIQELIQNADDAEAKEVAVIYDEREFESSKLIFPAMSKAHSTALLFYNSGLFSEDDFENILKVAGATKAAKNSKIGKFGVGFCSVYSITDVPSFVSGEHLVIFDPTLQHLSNEFSDAANPGIKVNFNSSRLMKKSNQLKPYEGVCNFNRLSKFSGTLFRFPLRKMKSAITSEVYSQEKIKSLIESVKENGSKLLMFLNHVRKISFHEIKITDYFTNSPTYEISSVQHSTDSSDVSLLAVDRKCNSDEDSEYWLIATDRQNVKIHDGSLKPGIASVSIKLEKISNFTYKASKVKGECFCFLPLHVETGLPVHVNSNFAVTTNRRGIWKSTAAATTYESIWNENVIEKVVTKAYIKLLVHLKKMQSEGSLVDYEFYSLWPISLKETNPWDKLLSEFYKSLLNDKSNHEVKLFYSSETKSWNQLRVSYFLCDDILDIASDASFREVVLKVSAKIFNANIVDISSQYWNQLSKHDDAKTFEAQVIDEEKFIKHFFSALSSDKMDVHHKTGVILAFLKAFSNSKHKTLLSQQMQATKCIPCSPDGSKFKQPLELINPNSELGILFTSDEEMFPNQVVILKYEAILKELGVIESTLSWELLLNRLQKVAEWYAKDHGHAVKCIAILVKYIKQNLEANQDIKEDLKHQLKNTPFLPVLQKPPNYPVKWEGAAHSATIKPSDLYYDFKAKISISDVCGSQVAVCDIDSIPQSQVIFTEEVNVILGIHTEIEVNHVIGHLKTLVECDLSTLSTDGFKKLDTIMNEVYAYLQTILNKSKDSKDLECKLHGLKEKACVWNGSKFLLPTQVSFRWVTDGPVLYKCPTVLAESNRSLMKQLGVVEDFTSKVLVEALLEIKDKYKKNRIPEAFQNLVHKIVPELGKMEISDILKSDTLELYLPNTKFVLVRKDLIKYNDVPWENPNIECSYCHSLISKDLAVKFGVETLRNFMLRDLDVTDKYYSKELDQDESVTQEIRNSLKEYSSGLQYLKEFFANAENCKSTKVYFILDQRTHHQNKLISEEWKSLQGPSLLIWNNATYSDERFADIQDILSINSSAKNTQMHNLLFKAVHHFTECPTFTTGDKMCIVDYNYSYIAQYTAQHKRKPVRIFSKLDLLWKRFPDMQPAYCNLPNEMQNGTLFRLPLRTPFMAQHSQIVGKNAYYNTDALKKKLTEWIDNFTQSLLYFSHISDVRVFAIDNSSTNCLHHIRTGKSKIIETFNRDNVNLTIYSVKLINNDASEEKWLVQLGLGNASKPTLKWNGIYDSLKHGIAIPTSPEHNFVDSGKLFCILPVSDRSKLPININGHFALTPDNNHIMWEKIDDCKDSDSKIEWNEQLLEAIAISYAYFLEKIRELILKDTKDRGALRTSLEFYYKQYPRSPNPKPWDKLTAQVYSFLHKQQVCTHAKIVSKAESAQASIASTGSPPAIYTIKWYKPRECEEYELTKEEPYVHDEDEETVKVLKCIGMNIIDCPKHVQTEFEKEHAYFTEISAETVLNIMHIF